MADKIKVPKGYSCVRIINSGSFGTVVELIAKATNTHYAGKMVQCLMEKDIERFNREVGRLRRFSHPRIVKLKEVVTMDNTKVMVMELGGKFLAEIVKDLTERKVLMAREDVYRVMEDIASALELMHSDEGGKTAHGDVKMENILTDADGHAKLCDFGAAESESVSNSRSVMTLMYVSPERMASETGRATCSADVWSLGVVLFWLLFGEPPFKSQNPPQQIREITSFKSKSPVQLIRQITSNQTANTTNVCGEEERALLMRMMDTSAESRVTCRQLRLSKSFRCIVNAVEGVWKLKDEDEQATRVKTEEEKVKLKEEWRKAEARARKAEQEILAAETRQKKAEADRMQLEKEKRRADEKTRIAEEKTMLVEERQRQAEEAIALAEREKEKLSDEVLRIRKRLGEARGRNGKSGREKRESIWTMGPTKETMPTAWVGTESLQSLNRTAHALTPTTLTQIVKLDLGTNWRTAFTFPIDEGDWELKIRASENTFVNVSVFFSLLIISVLGFLKHPLPKDATQNGCGYWMNGIGGDFVLWNGRMWRGGAFKPVGTNKKCDRIGQTAAIRVNMLTREAKLFVDDEEQPGIFTDIPSPLCLGITTGFIDSDHQSVEVLWLKRLRGSDDRERSVPKETTPSNMCHRPIRLMLLFSSATAGLVAVYSLFLKCSSK
ncbi:putative CBL-interacting protein kinase 19 [Blattamonas nauphoetae]|uniref:CBL-interacting protein kinase 19 n=1 Tax=Blattamonas nauphoetae TaxID=2049346 RepID=A0ABQ9WVA7_9EUKA|nr:putative CBL-interacting protein kinase 19 [Blattamonas nauphoetae]